MGVCWPRTAWLSLLWITYICIFVCDVNAFLKLFFFSVVLVKRMLWLLDACNLVVAFYGSSEAGTSNGRLIIPITVSSSMILPLKPA